MMSSNPNTALYNTNNNIMNTQGQGQRYGPTDMEGISFGGTGASIIKPQIYIYRQININIYIYYALLFDMRGPNA